MKYFQIMPPKKSLIWKHFSEDIADPTNVLCKVPGCSKSKVSRGKQGSSKGNLSNIPMVNHLKNNHPKEFSDFTEAKLAKDEDEKKKLEEEADSNEMEGGIVPVFQLRTQKQRQEFLSQSNLNNWVGGGIVQLGGSGSEYKIHDPRAKDRHRGILMMVILDLQPWNFVSDPGFLHFSSQMDPHYRVASTTFYRELLNRAYKKGVAIVQEKIKKDDPTTLACQLDGWSSYRHGYIGLQVNYITPSWKRVNICLACSPFDDHHTGEKLGNWLEEKLGTWKVLDKTTVVVSDTAANMLCMMNFLPNDMERVNCLNHVLQLAINDEVFEKPEVTSIIANVKAVTNYASSSVLLSEAIRKKQEDLGFKSIKTLTQDVRTRWNSTNDMVERFVELKDPITEVLESEEWKDKITVKPGVKVKFTSNDWRVLERLVQVLKPFKEATLKLSAKQACVSESIPILASLHHTLKLANNNAIDRGVRDLKTRLDQNLKNRTGHLEENEIHAMATLLDWRYKNCYFMSNAAKEKSESRLVELLRQEVGTIPPLPGADQDIFGGVVVDEANNNSKGCLEDAFEAIRKKARMDDTAEPVETEENVIKEFLRSKLKEQNLASWSKYEEESQGSDIRLALCKLARKFLTPPPTSTNSERLFSVAGQVMDEKRAKTLPDSLEKILFLRENIVVCNFALDW